MAKVTYLPQDGDPAETTFHGVNLKANVAVETSNEKLIAMASSNPWFKVEGAADKPKAAEPAKGGKPTPENKPTVVIPKGNTGEPKTAEEYRAYAVEWFKTVRTIEEMETRWKAEEGLRNSIGVGTDDYDYLATLYNPKADALRKAAKG